ncbi:SH3 domain-containing protein [Saprospira sp. CCB-QB6]|uniref:SH3 domain-containing protein n=1 Tax=Saprospira sp. CCB-QB6 TaxID=3023936 RepID=UPI00234A8B01|nr:SH3 domain-containing protein [Saprospira sp. CCB-QB6]WCL81880.1 SH3 domain-containing protein [Saprospira sp. CCB-QB6]
MSESSRKRRERKRAQEEAKKQQQKQIKLNLEEAPKEKKGLLAVLRPIELVSGGLLIGSLLLYGVSRCSRTEELPSPEVVAVDSAAVLQPAAPQAAAVKYYVVLDSLKFRTGPYLDSTLIRILPHGEELISLNKVTDFEQGLRVSVDEFTREPWVKVRDKNGREGWVYGAGIRPYRKNKPAPRPEPVVEEEAENSNSETEQ